MTQNRNTNTTRIVINNKQEAFKNISNASLTDETLFVVGTSSKGPAFVPTSVTSFDTSDDIYNTFSNIFGDIESNTISNSVQHRYHYGPYAAKKWFDNENRHLVYTRVLGVGENAGFTRECNLVLNNSNENYFTTTDFYTLNLNTSPYKTFSSVVEENKRIVSAIYFSDNNSFSYSYLNATQDSSILDYVDTKNNSINYKSELFESKKNLVYQDISLQFTSNVGNIINRTQEVDDDTIKLFNADVKFQKAKTPWVISQVFKSKGDKISDLTDLANTTKKLFRFYSLSDGESGNNLRFRITPKIVSGIDETDPELMWSIFDLEIYEFNKATREYTVRETYEDLNLDVYSKDFIGRRIGNIKTYYDFESEKIESIGEFRNVSKLVRVEIDKNILDGKIENYTLIPCGFLGYPRIEDNNDYYWINPLFRGTLLRDNNGEILEEKEYWGVSFDSYKLSTTTDNVIFDELIDGRKCLIAHEIYSKFNPILKDPNDSEISHREYDIFSIEKLVNNNRNQQSNSQDLKLIWYDFLPESVDANHINVYDMLKHDEGQTNGNGDFLCFDFFSYGGFDGTNIFEDNERILNVNILQDETNNSFDVTEESYKLAKDISLEESWYTADLFLIPGLTNTKLYNEISNRVNGTNTVFIYDVLNLYNVGDSLESRYFKRLDDDVIEERQKEINIEESILNNFSENKEVILTCGLLDIKGKSEIPSSIGLIDLLKYSNFNSINSIELSQDFTSVFDINENDDNFAEIVKLASDFKINLPYNKNNGVMFANSNMLVDNKKNIIRYFNNRRLMNNIKKDLKFSLIASNDTPLLFSIINESQIVTNNFENVLSYYRNNNFIKNYYVNVQKSSDTYYNTNKLNNTFKSTVIIELNNSSTETIFLDQILMSNELIANGSIDLTLFK
jgi:hypothetical protein